MLESIKAIYRANIFCKSKPIRPRSFPEGYFMKESPLAKDAVTKKSALQNVVSKFIAIF